MLTREKTLQAFGSLCEHIPGGVNSGARAFVGLGQTPLIISSASGDTLTDVDGHTYFDLCCSWGPLIHGHAHPEVVAAVSEQLTRGMSYGITCEAEEKLARKVCELMPTIEKVRFVNSGTEATMSALRLARGFTQRDTIIKFVGCYHGHADFLLVQAGSGVAHLNEASSAGVPREMVKNTLCLPYNDIEALSAIDERVAAVIVEPIAGNMGVVPATKEFLQVLREKTKECGALLIFDEVITGFRVGLGGAQELYGIEPDMTCLGKVVGGGFPVAAFGGSSEIMDHLSPMGQVYQAGTLSGNPVAMVAGLKTLELCEAPNFYQTIEAKARLLCDPLEEKVCVQRVGSMFTIFMTKGPVRNFADAKACDHKQFADLFGHLLHNGVYLSPSPYETLFVSGVHRDGELIRTRDLALEIL